MQKKSVLKELEDRLAKLAPSLRKEDLEPAAIEELARDLEFLQNKTKQLNAASLNEQIAKDLQTVL